MKLRFSIRSALILIAVVALVLAGGRMLRGWIRSLEDEASRSLIELYRIEDAATLMAKPADATITGPRTTPPAPGRPGDQPPPPPR